jgi:hypothetical protein
MSAGDDLMDSSGDARIGVPPARRALLSKRIAITVKHDMRPLSKHPYAVNVFRIKRPECDSLRVRFPVPKSSFLKLDNCDQKLFSVVCGDDFSV